MNALPSMVVLDFLEWLRKKQNQNSTDILELLADDTDQEELFELARTYLRYGVHDIRYILHQFIDSRGFEEYLMRYRSNILDVLHPNYRINDDDTRFFFREFERIMIETFNEGGIYVHGIDVEHLVNSVKYYIRKKNEPVVMKFMMGLQDCVSLEIDFLEWLDKVKNKPINLDKMPLLVFEDLVNKFYDYTGSQNSDDRKKLIKSFKSSDSNTLYQKLIAILTDKQIKRMKSLGYLYSRYSNRNIPFRCFFLPLFAEASTLEGFIKKYWEDLDSLSADYLDIFYSEEDIGKSGYATKASMKLLSQDLSEKLPCIIIWCNDLKAAKHIDISGLKDEELIRLVAMIVDNIKRAKKLERIAKEANIMAKELNDTRIDAQRLTTNNTFNIHENSGIVAGKIDHSTILTSSIQSEGKKFANEAKQAIEIIDSFIEVDQEYRKAFITLVKEADLAIQEENETKKATCKDKFRGFIMGAGKVVEKIIAALSNLSTIAGFFGF